MPDQIDAPRDPYLISFSVDHAALADAIELQMGEVYKGRKEADGVKMYAGIVRAMQEESFLDKERERIESEMEEEGVDAAMRKHLQVLGPPSPAP